MPSRFFRISNPQSFRLIVLAAAVMSCQDQTVSDPSAKDPAAFAAKLVSISGTVLTGPAKGTLAPLRLRVTDAGGTPVAGATVRFEVRSGEGTVTPASAVSAQDGTVSADWTLGAPLGEQSVAAILAVQFPVDSVLVRATATTPIGPVQQAFRLRWIRGGAVATQLQSDTTGATSDTLEVQLYNPSGGLDSGVAGQTVTWVTGGPNTVDGGPVNSTVVTDANGKARAVWMYRDATGAAIPPSPVAKRMIASVASVGQVEFQSRVYPGKLNTVALSLGAASPTTSFPTTLTATATDANGFKISGAVVAFSVDVGVLSAASATTTSDGTATVIWTTGATPGPQTATATASYTATPYAVSSSVTGTKSVAVTLAPPVLTKVTSDPEGVALSVVPVTVKVTDSASNPLPGRTVSFSVTKGGGTVSAPSAVSIANGNATVTWTLGAKSGATPPVAVTNELTVTVGSVSVTFTAIVPP